MNLKLLASLNFTKVWANKPGPATYYSHFSCLYLSACLAFQTLQVHRLMLHPNQSFGTNKWSDIIGTGYLALLTLAGCMDGVLFAFTPKADTIAVSFLAFLDGVSVIVYKFYEKGSQGADQNAAAGVQYQNVSPKNGPTASSQDLEFEIGSEDIIPKPTSTNKRQNSRLRRCGVTTLKVFNRILMVIHAALVILSVVGAVELALTYRYANPYVKVLKSEVACSDVCRGTKIKITLASGDVHTVNYNCTSVPASNNSLPTIWFEADAAHGIVDFLGLQTVLALDHGRNSCSYDPPSFGWSDPLPAKLLNFFAYFSPLLSALQRQDEEMVIVGWGGGAEPALMHAIENEGTTKSLVMMDASPDGIEWFDAQRKSNWTEVQMLNYRSSDLSGRVFLAKTILGLALPW